MGAHPHPRIMSNESKKQRYVVCDLGFAFAVHDTQVEQAYAFRAGADAKHLSSNELNSVRVDLLPNMAEAVRVATELNARAAS